MPLTRRLFASIASVLLLQLTLLGSGTLCASASTSDAAAAPSMAGMSAAEHESGSGCADDVGSDRCDDESDASCVSLGACATIAFQVTAALRAPADSLVIVALPAPAALRSLPGDSPDLPPPRA